MIRNCRQKKIHNAAAEFRRIPLLCLVLLFVFTPLLLSAAGRGQNLVPANFAQKTDAMGFRWDIQPDGSINDGTNDCFDGGLRLQVNGNNFRCNRPQMTADGSELVLAGITQSFGITRRIKVDTQASSVRYIETVTNNQGRKASVSLTLHTDFGSTPQQIVSTTGAQNPTSLGKKDSGVVAIQQVNYGRPSVVFFLADPKSKVKPTIRRQSDDCYFLYTLSVPPGKSVSIVHGIMQRRLSGVPNEKQMKQLYASFTSRKWLKDLPRDLRRTIKNKQRGYGSFLVPGLSFDLGEIELNKLNSDLLVLGAETRLRGSCSCAALSVEGRYGTVDIPFQRVAALTGAKSQGGETRVFLRDGQVLKGVITAEEFQFAMPSGLSVSLNMDKLDRLVMRSQPDDFTPSSHVAALVETYEGDRLSVLSPEAAQAAASPVSVDAPAVAPVLHARTLWGTLKAPFADIISVKPLPENLPGHHVMLKDGSRFSAFLAHGKLSLQTELFGVREIEATGVRSIHAAHLVSAEEKEDLEEITEPYFVLAGENIVVGRIDLSQVTFVTSGDSIPVPPNQIRELHNISLETGERVNRNALFSAVIWGGGTVSGSLREAILPVRVGESIWHVPVQDLAHAFVPTPFVADSLRKRIAGLIRQLGHSDWKKRDEANRELKELGHMARTQLQEARDRISDPEIVRRVRFLLEELQE